jgi:hypothetical protein
MGSPPDLRSAPGPHSPIYELAPLRFRYLFSLNKAGTKANSSAANLKKGPLAELAETTLAGTGWLPEPIRIAPEQPEDTSFALFENEEEVTEEQP